MGYPDPVIGGFMSLGGGSSHLDGPLPTWEQVMSQAREAGYQELAKTRTRASALAMLGKLLSEVVHHPLYERGEGGGAAAVLEILLGEVFSKRMEPYAALQIGDIVSLPIRTADSPDQAEGRTGIDDEPHVDEPHAEEMDV